MDEYENWIKNVHWIGGSSCSGKSSCAKRMSERFGLPLYNTDVHAFGEFMFGLQDETQYPAIVHYRNNILKGMDEFVKADTKVLFLDFIAYCREVFPLLLNDIRNLSTNQKIIVEGAHVLPEFLSAITNPGPSIFLVSTARQQRRIWRKEMRQEIPGGHPGEIENYAKSQNKSLVEKKRVALHERIAAFIKTTALKSGQRLVISDYAMTEQKLDSIVAGHLFPDR